MGGRGEMRGMGGREMGRDGWEGERWCEVRDGWEGRYGFEGERWV